MSADKKYVVVQEGKGIVTKPTEEKSDAEKSKKKLEEGGASSLEVKQVING